MVTRTTPGVYVDEQPTPAAITSAPAWTPAFLGQTEASAAGGLADSPVGVPTLVTSWNDFQAKFGLPVWRSFLPWVVSTYFKEGGGPCYVVNLPNDENVPSATASNKFTIPPTGTAVGTITFEAASPGRWGNLLWVSVELNGSAINIKVLVQGGDVGIPKKDASSNAYAISQIDKNIIKNFINYNSIGVEANPPKKYAGTDSLYVLEFFSGLSSSVSEFTQRINLSSSFIRVAVSSDDPKNPVSSLTLDEQCFALGGGLVTGMLNAGVVQGSDPKLAYDAALAALAKIQGISLISIPDASIMMANDHSSGTFSDSGNEAVQETSELTTINAVLAQCATSKWFCVVDPPVTESAGTIAASTDALSFKNGGPPTNGGNPLTSDFGALYWPNLRVASPSGGGKVFSIPPSGAILARYVTTALNVGVHQAAAGVRYGSLSTIALLDVERPIVDSDQDAIYPSGINVIRNRVNYGMTIWGARTLSLDPSWTYVPVRLLFNQIEVSLVNGLQWVPFMPNNETLWHAVTRDVTAFLYEFWKAGALFGNTQNDAFRVTCNETNNTPETIAEGYLYVRVEIAPVRPAEFVIIEISQKMANANVGA